MIHPHHVQNLHAVAGAAAGAAIVRIDHRADIFGNVAPEILAEVVERECIEFIPAKAHVIAEEKAIFHECREDHSGTGMTGLAEAADNCLFIGE